MLEQKVKHVSAMKFVTDQESSRFQYVRGTLVIFVFVYSAVQLSKLWLSGVKIALQGPRCEYHGPEPGPLPLHIR